MKMSKFFSLMVLFLLLIISYSAVVSADSELFFTYDVGDDQLAVLPSYGYGIGDYQWNSTGGSGGSAGGVATWASDNVTYVVGDGVCDSDLGESLLVSPVDCRPTTSKNNNELLLWLLAILLLLIIYVYYQKKKGVY